LNALDGFAFGVRLLRESVAVAGDRLVSPPGGAPRNLAGVTPEWLTEALREQVPDATVRSIRREDAHAGTTARARFAIDAEGAADLPGSVFVKLPPSDLPTRLFVNLMGLGRNETRFYRELRSELPVRAPRAWHVAVAGAGGRFALVLEDLAARGCRFRDVREPCGADEARAVVTELARLHAAYWASPRFRSDLAWLGGHDGGRVDRVERFVRDRLVEAAFRRFGDAIPEPLRASPGAAARCWPALLASWSRAAPTVIHGDPHLGNLYFDGEDPGFFDWQVVQRGAGMRDVSYFLANSLATETRRAHERDLLAAYARTLEGEGVDGFGPDEAWEQHRSNVLYAWIAALAAAGAARLQAEPIVRIALARTGAAVVDLDSLGARWR